LRGAWYHLLIMQDAHLVLVCTKLKSTLWINIQFISEHQGNIEAQRGLNNAYHCSVIQEWRIIWAKTRGFISSRRHPVSCLVIKQVRIASCCLWLRNPNDTPFWLVHCHCWSQVSLWSHHLKIKKEKNPSSLEAACLFKPTSHCPFKFYAVKIMAGVIQDSWCLK
jgi:hypothetical protein